MENLSPSEAKLWIMYYIIHQIPCSNDRFMELMKIAGYIQEDIFDIGIEPMEQ